MLVDAGRRLTPRRRPDARWTPRTDCASLVRERAGAVRPLPTPSRRCQRLTKVCLRLMLSTAQRIGQHRPLPPQTPARARTIGRPETRMIKTLTGVPSASSTWRGTGHDPLTLVPHDNGFNDPCSAVLSRSCQVWTSTAPRRSTGWSVSTCPSAWPSISFCAATASNCISFRATRLSQGSVSLRGGRGGTVEAAVRPERRRRGSISGQAQEFREFVLTDPDGNRIGIGSPHIV